MPSDQLGMILMERATCKENLVDKEVRTDTSANGFNGTDVLATQSSGIAHNASIDAWENTSNGQAVWGWKVDTLWNRQ